MRTVVMLDTDFSEGETVETELAFKAQDDDGESQPSKQGIEQHSPAIPSAQLFLKMLSRLREELEGDPN